jgi:hypothetical protein
MSGYEYEDDGDKITFDPTGPRSQLDNGNMIVTISGQQGCDHDFAVLVMRDKFPEFLAGIAEQMGLRAVIYAGQDVIGSPADFPDRQVGNLNFRIDRTGTQVAIRRGPRGVVCGMLEGWEQAQTAGAILTAMGDVLREDLDRKIAEKARQTKLASDLAEVIMRGDLSHMSRGRALSVARGIIDSGWNVIPPAVDGPVPPDEDDERPSNKENHA